MMNTSRDFPSVRLHDMRPRLSRRYCPLLHPPASKNSIRQSSSSSHSGTNPTISDVIPCYFMYNWINKQHSKVHATRIDIVDDGFLNVANIASARASSTISLRQGL